LKESDYEKASIIYNTLSAYEHYLEELQRMMDKIQSDDNDPADFTYFIHIVLNNDDLPNYNKISAAMFEKDVLEKILNIAISEMKKEIVKLKEQLDEL